MTWSIELSAAFPGRATDRYFINAGSRDVELYRHLAFRMQLPPVSQSIPDSWGQAGRGLGHSDLLRYCKIPLASCAIE